MVFNAQVYALADKYDILALKALAAAKFEALAKHGWNTTDSTLFCLVFRVYVNVTIDLGQWVSWVS